MMDAAVASFSSSSPALSRGHPLYFHAARARGLCLRPQGVFLQNSLGLKWVAAKPLSARLAVMASVTGSGDSPKRRGRKPSSKSSQTAGETKGKLGNVGAVGTSNSIGDEGAPVAKPKRKRGRPKKSKIIEGSSATRADASEEEEEWDFFGELASHIENEHRAIEEGRPGTWNEAEETATAAMSNVGITMRNTGSIPKPASPSVGGRQGSKEENAREREDDTSADGNIDDDEVDLNDPKYYKKPDWMHEEVWQSFNEQVDEDDEGQPLWVEEEDPTWPEEGEDGWGFRTSQFFDKVSVTSDKNDDDDDDDDRLKLNWDSEADDWTIKEITSNDWEHHVFNDPSPLVVYVFARYGRRGLDSWKTLVELQKAVNTIWESEAKAPLRAVKVDVGMEIDLRSALKIDMDQCPQLLLIKNGKGLYRLEGNRTSEELVQVMAHFFYNGARPSFLNSPSSPETLESIV